MTSPHADRAHAKLSASGSSRWMACTPSARMEKDFKDTTSEFAEEGTAAHELSEIFLLHETKVITKLTRSRRLNKFKKDNKYYSEAMEEYVQSYVDVVMERVNEAYALTKDVLVLVEQRLDFSEWVPEGFGTGDVLIIADGQLEVVDLKYGKGVPVDAAGNSQMRLYGLGALNRYSFLYDIENVRMTIVQPRLDSVSTETLSVDDLLDWAESQVKPKAAAAAAGEGEFVPGSHCRFCKARAVCKARADENLKMAEYDFADPDVLSKEDIAAILSKAVELQKWASDVSEYALAMAENHGEKFPGYKLVEGRSNRKYTDVEMVKNLLIENYYSEDTIFKPKEIKTITALEKEIGKKAFTEILSGYIVKAPGKPTLVPETDKRPELNSVESAIEDFSE